MSAERYKRVDQVFQQALSQPPERLEAFLNEACAGDEELRREVASLLKHERQAGTFMDSPAAATLADDQAEQSRQESIGRTLLHYRILEKIGEGGMGVVYRAEDSHLRRSVAIKLLPPGKMADPERKKRFIHEARVASALNHPNIVTIHDIDQAEGFDFIAMEYVEGRPLAQVIGCTGLPLPDLMNYAVQISDALGAAHAAGIIHRDLKPANIMITGKGSIKVLDFGLAKLIDSANSDESARTETLRTRTAEGLILGTVAYMSPEQAAGQHLDVRTDIFSFGSLVYEALTGRPAFRGNSSVSIMAAVMRDTPPPPKSLRADVPADFARIIWRCLEKDRDARYPSAGELHKDLLACRARFVRRSTGLYALIRRPSVALPCLAVIVLLAIGGVWLAIRGSHTRWARQWALPEAARLIQNEELNDAFHLVRQAARYIPSDAELKKLESQCAVPANVKTVPPGAEVFWRSYRDVKSAWESLGQSPVNGTLIPRGYLRWKVNKEGYEPVELALSGSDPIDVTLHPSSSAPGMIHVPATKYWDSAHGLLSLDEFWLDKYEVTNRQFKNFIDKGGYAQKKFWTHEFVEDGRRIPWEEAMERCRDTTGRPGPATWELGSFPEGHDDYPVGGVSWYEAAAFAEFAGKSLPTVYHWRNASPGWGPFEIVSLSNFGGQGPVPVGSREGLATYGSYDMAGNVKEWCWNEVDGFRYLMGGAWNEPTYSFNEPDAQSPMKRSANYGFRCARYVTPLAAQLTAEYRLYLRDYSKERPADDLTFNVYRRMFAYDRTDLRASTEAVDDTGKYWRREKVTVDAVVRGERVIAILFLPRNVNPPYQTVVYIGGAEMFLEKSTSASIDGQDIDFLMRSGRAVLVPVVKWSYERGSGGRNQVPRTGVIWRDAMVNWCRELGRSLDYLETRSDIDNKKLAYFGWSAGGIWGPVFTAVEQRFRTAVLVVAGLPIEQYIAEVDPINFAPRVHIPVLMLNGRFDYGLPADGSQLPLFRLLGVPATQKKHVQFDTSHTVPRLPMIKETLDWLDRQLGPVHTGARER